MIDVLMAFLVVGKRKNDESYFQSKRLVQASMLSVLIQSVFLILTKASLVQQLSQSAIKKE